jgi:protein DGCR14
MPKQPVPSFSASLSKSKKENQLATSYTKVDIKYAEKKVLPEDKYLEGMSKAVRQEFFPDLARLEVEEAYLDALERADLVGLRSATKQYIEITQTTKEDESGLLLEYSSSHTSEDNRSFELLMDKDNSVKRQKFEKVFGGPALLKDAPSRRLLLKSSQPDSFKINHEKSLTHKKIKVSNTRLKSEPLPTATTNHFSLEEEALPLESAVYRKILMNHSQLDGPDETRSVTTAAGFDFVPSTPVITPGVQGTPLMTWGTIEQTPMRLNESANGTPFRFPAGSEKDRLTRSMSKDKPKTKANAPALKNILKATLKASDPFHFETKSTKSSDKSESISSILNTPIIPRTPVRTPRLTPSQHPNHTPLQPPK